MIGGDATLSECHDLGPANQVTGRSRWPRVVALVPSLLVTAISGRVLQRRREPRCVAWGQDKQTLGSSPGLPDSRRLAGQRPGDDALESLWGSATGAEITRQVRR